MIVRELVTRLGFDADSAERAAGRFNRTADRVRRTMRGVVQVSIIAKGAMLAFGVGTAVAGDSIAKTADKLGIGIRELQEYRYAAERAGVAQGTFDMAMQRFTRRAAEATKGKGEAKDALAELGIGLKDANGQMRPSVDLLRDVADRMSGIQDPARRLRIAFKLFDSEGVAMVNMLKNGSAGLDEMTERARLLGLVMSEDVARASETFQDNSLDMRLALRGLQYTIGSVVLPRMNQAAKGVLEWVMSNRKLIDQRVERAIEFISGALDGFWTVLTEVKKALDPFVEALGGWDVVLAGLAVVLGALYMPLGLIIGLIALVLEDIQKFVEGQPSLIGEMLEIWESFVAWFEKLPDRIGDWLDKTMEKIRKFVRDQAMELAKVTGVQEGVETANDLSNRAAGILSGETDVRNSLFGRLLGLGGADVSLPTPAPVTNETVVNQQFTFPGMQFHTKTDDPQKLARELKRYLEREIGNAQTNLPGNF